MEDFANILERDYGLKPQGKMAPMSNTKQPPFSSASIAKPSSAGNPRNGTNHRSSAPILGDDEPFFGKSGVRSSSSGRNNTFSGSDPYDVFGRPAAVSSSTHIFEDIFKPAALKSTSVSSGKGPASYPVFDAPVYDDDIFGGMPGIRSVDSAFEDVFKIGSAGAAAPTKSPASYDDLLGGFASSDANKTNSEVKPTHDATSAGESAFDELLPGFGAAEPAKPQSSLEDGKPSQRNISKPVNGFSANILEDPFAVFESDNVLHTNPSTRASNIEATTGGSDGLSRNNDRNDNSTSSVTFENDVPHHSPDLNKASAAAESYLPKKSKSGLSQSPSGVSESGDSNDVPLSTASCADDIVTKERKKAASSRAKVDSSMPASSAESASASSPYRRSRATRNGDVDDASKRSRQTFRESAVSPREQSPPQIPKVGKGGRVDEFWLSIDDVKLVTQPTTVPPPVRPPPVPGSTQGRTQQKPSPEGRPTENGGHSPVDPHVNGGFDSPDSALDDLEVFASGSSRRIDADMKDDGASSPGEEEQGSAAATASGAAMREAIERAEAKLRQAKEAKDRDREEARGTRNNEGGPAHNRDDGGETKVMQDREEREREAREKLHKEKEREEREREKQREREREREKDRANEIARQRAAVERANAEVREREAQRAVERAAEARIKVERAAVGRATAEARERHERAAGEKARAAAAAEREKAEKDRAAEKARAERAAAAEREKAEKDRMAASRDQPRKNEDDLESFFRSTSRPTSAPKQRTHPTDGFPTAPPSNEGLWRSTNSASVFNVKKVPSMPSISDDLTSLFGGPSTGPGTFQELEGESADRRKARWDRHQRTLERAAKALDEKHQRDLRSAKDQEERHRAGELVDAEIKRWAAGKEGNLRALLSTLQYVLWPECGWQAVSLTDLITAAAVKKVYRKATLYVHPDKVQQKGATNQQKYIAEKVFDLLKEAWNKFNSEELF